MASRPLTTVHACNWVLKAHARLCLLITVLTESAVMAYVFWSSPTRRNGSSARFSLLATAVSFRMKSDRASTEGWRMCVTRMAARSCNKFSATSGI